MKINHKFFSLPPYISTQWNHVKGLYMRGGALVINLTSGETIQIPNLQPDIIDLIFSAHAAHLEQEEAAVDATKNALSFPSKEQLDGFLHFGAISGDGLTAMMQHNSAHAEAPDLPREILQKIHTIMQVIAPGEMIAISPPERDCNCPHCQITRAIQGEVEPTKADETSEPVEEEVTERDLCFEQWNIVQTGDQLFTVTNKLEATEQFQVYLGQPVGCTCGQEGCEHILAVLKS